MERSPVLRPLHPQPPERDRGDARGRLHRGRPETASAAVVRYGERAAGDHHGEAAGQHHRQEGLVYETAPTIGCAPTSGPWSTAHRNRRAVLSTGAAPNHHAP